MFNIVYYVYNLKYNIVLKRNYYSCSNKYS